MSDERTPIVISNPWERLRAHTPARIALGRTGISLPTAPHLAFQLAHARARKAVHHELDTEALRSALVGFGMDILIVQSAAADRSSYLQRPDKGRRLDPASCEALHTHIHAGAAYDVALVIGDGLSALAIEENARLFLEALLPRLRGDGLTIAPLVIVRQARVAVGDEVGALLKARLVVVMIGERPGLSSPNSMGLYMTYAPKVGLTDEARNCISNVRPEGLGYDSAAHRLHYLIAEAVKRGLSGVALKDESEIPSPAISSNNKTALFK
ncbi:MAG: ethanolamine ammonia-lyase subunit EutC [Hyphomicrobium sp.]|jgi:ethanolamine ammonia-lyase small subunit